MPPPHPNFVIVKLQNCLICLVIFSLILMFVYDPKVNQETYNKNQELLHGTIGLITLDFTTLSGITGLGNKLYEIAALYGIASKLQMIAYIPEHLRFQVSELRKVFPFFKPLIIKVPNSKIVNFGRRANYENVLHLVEYSNRDITLNGSYFQSWRYFDHIRQNISNMFAFSAGDLSAALNIVEDAQIAIYLNSEKKTRHNAAMEGEFKKKEKKVKKSASNQKITCVHIRREDFLIINMASREDFTNNSVSFIRRKRVSEGKKRTLFLVLGDDRDWAEELFRNHLDVFVAPKPVRPGTDLALMAKFCDDIILTASASTFGFWGAYLSEKATVYYNSESYDFRTKYATGTFLPEWIPLNLGDTVPHGNDKKIVDQILQDNDRVRRSHFAQVLS